MNDEMSAFSIIKSVASRGLADQTKHEGDRVDGRGILICGKCGEPRQMFKSFPNPSKEDPQHRSTIKVVVMCRCERDEAAKKEKDREFAREYGKIQAIREARECFKTIKVTKPKYRQVKQRHENRQPSFHTG